MCGPSGSKPRSLMRDAPIYVQMELDTELGGIIEEERDKVEGRSSFYRCGLDRRCNVQRYGWPRPNAISCTLSVDLGKRGGKRYERIAVALPLFIIFPCVPSLSMGLLELCTSQCGEIAHPCPFLWPETELVASTSFFSTTQQSPTSSSEVVRNADRCR